MLVETAKNRTKEQIINQYIVLRKERVMYCILVTGIPAAGKSTMADFLGERLKLPIISKDSIKELLFDTVGFESREEKVRLGAASMDIMYYVAKQLMKVGQPFILENNFENSSKAGLTSILKDYKYSALTVTLTGEYKTIYQRFLERNVSPDRHRGHVVNDCYPEKKERSIEELKAASIRYEDYLYGIEHRGFDAFCAEGEQIIVDTTDFAKVNLEELLGKIQAWKEKLS